MPGNLKENPTNKSINLAELDVKVAIYKGENDPATFLEDLQDYAALMRQPNHSIETFNDYIKNKYFKDSDDVVIADLSGLNIQDADLKSIDLSGSLLKNTTFNNCELGGVIFCDINLSGTRFNDCKLGSADFRGSDLSSTVFALANESEIRANAELKKEYIGGIKFSTSAKLAMQYADTRLGISRQKDADEHAEILHEMQMKMREELEASGEDQKIIEGMMLDVISLEYTPDEGMRLYEDPDIRKEKNYQDIKDFVVKKWHGIKEQEEKINNKWQQLSYLQAAYVRTGMASGNKEYDDLVEDLGFLRQEAFVKKADYVIHPSFKHIFTEDALYDPVYIRGSSRLERDRKTEYIKLERADAEEYLRLLKDEPHLTLNDFARGKSANKDDVNIRFVADCGVRSNDLNNQLERPNFSGLDFSGANLDGANFAGANLEGAIFNQAGLSNTSFEGARLIGAQFSEVIARDANFFNANLSKATIKGSDFKRAFMPRSIGAASIENSNFNYSNISTGQWDGVKIADSTLDYANLEGISMANADIQRVRAQHAILNRAMLDHTKLVEVDLGASLMDNISAVNVRMKGVILKDVEARGIDFTDAELDELTKLDGADLEGAIFIRIKAAGASFIKANMDKIHGEFADLQRATLDGASLRFANLNRALLDQAKARGVDMTGVDLQDARAVQADFTEAAMVHINGARAIFTEASFEKADLHGSDLRNAIMTKVNARKANLRDIQAQEAKLNEADLSEAHVNANTRLDEADISGAKGGMIREDGAKVTPAEQQEQNHAAAKAERIPKFLRGAAEGLSGAFKKCAKGAHAVARFTREPISGKWAAIGGAIAGAAITIAVISSAVLTGGLSIPVIAGIVIGAAVVGGASGYVASKSRIVRDVLLGIGGFFVGGAPGAAAAVVTMEGVTIAAPLVEKGCNAAVEALPTQAGIDIAREAEGCKEAAELSKPSPDQEKARPMANTEIVNIQNATAINLNKDLGANREREQGVKDKAMKIAQEAALWVSGEVATERSRRGAVSIGATRKSTPQI